MHISKKRYHLIEIQRTTNEVYTKEKKYLIIPKK